MAEGQKKKGHRKAILVGAIAGSVVAVAAAATAAALTLSSTAVLSGLVTPVACDTAYDVNPGTPVWDDALGDYKITTAVYSNVDASCSGDFMKVDVLNGSGNSISNGGGVVGGSGSGTFSLTSAVPVNDWVSVASTIYTP